MTNTKKEETPQTAQRTLVQSVASVCLPPRWLSIPHVGRESEQAVTRAQLAATLDALLPSVHVTDYCPNGLQVEGGATITRLVCGVTASLAFLQGAVALHAQAVLVHHGWFWRGEDPRVRGAQRARLATVLAHDINLFAYHLPLDQHPQWGNNVQLAQHVGWPEGVVCGRDGGMRRVDLPEPWSATRLHDVLTQQLGRPPILVGALERPLRRLAWITGAGQDYLQEAIDLGVDALVSGEINERTTHLARECGVLYVAAGHHATERYGVQAVGAELARRLPLDVLWLEDPNPI